MNYHKNLGDWKNKDISIIYNEDNSLIAVQGPKSQALLDDILGTSLTDMDFMTSKEMKYKGDTIRISRCGYTGEDGFEVSVPVKHIAEFADTLTNYKDKSG